MDTNKVVFRKEDMKQTDRDKIRERFSSWLQDTRREQKLTLQELADRTGLSKSVIHKYEKARCLPEYESAEALGEGLGLLDQTLLLAGFVPKFYCIKKLMTILDLNYFEQ